KASRAAQGQTFLAGSQVPDLCPSWLVFAAIRVNLRYSKTATVRAEYSKTATYRAECGAYPGGQAQDFCPAFGIPDADFHPTGAGVYHCCHNMSAIGAVGQTQDNASSPLECADLLTTGQVLDDHVRPSAGCG